MKNFFTVLFFLGFLGAVYAEEACKLPKDNNQAHNNCASVPPESRCHCIEINLKNQKIMWGDRK